MGVGCVWVVVTVLRAYGTPLVHLLLQCMFVDGGGRGGRSFLVESVGVGSG